MGWRRPGPVSGRSSSCAPSKGRSSGSTSGTPFRPAFPVAAGAHVVSASWLPRAVAVPAPRQLGIPDAGYELQMLYGMAEPVQAAMRRVGLRLRVYAPVGELVPGMAYLVRRPLENTPNQRFAAHPLPPRPAPPELVAPPAPVNLP